VIWFVEAGVVILRQRGEGERYLSRVNKKKMQRENKFVNRGAKREALGEEAGWPGADCTLAKREGLLQGRF